MCTLFLALDAHPAHRLVVAANRDEAHERPAAPAGFWEEAPELLAGRDLKAGGTWMGATRTGRFAVITNIRDLPAHRPDALSRGHLVREALIGAAPPREFLERLADEAGAYNPFNLIAGDGAGLYYLNSRERTVQRLEPGIYGLSNDVLDTPWPKVVRGRAAFADLLSERRIDREALMALMRDETRAPDEALPDTGVGIELERILSSIFIPGERYGTRMSTVVTLDPGGGTFAERRFGPVGSALGETRFDFEVAG
jgi:uncharacterized protein with NRDE domain